MSTLKDLNKHLFDQLERLSTASKDGLQVEVERAEAIQKIGTKIIDAHRTQLDAVKLVAEYRGLHPDQTAPQISVGDMDIEV